MTLVVNADDLGLSPAVTKGVIESHRRGIVRSTSLLVTFPSSEEGAAEALAERDLEVGIHLDLVGGRPVCDPGTVRTLCDPEGRFFKLPELSRRVFTGRVSMTEVAAELRAQIQRARSWGVPALAWDSHRHVHLMPPVARVVGSLARELGAGWIRRGRAPRRTLAPKSIALHLSSVVSEMALRRTPGNDWFLDLTAARPRLDAPAVALLAMLRGLGEVAAHPGYVDDDLRRADTLVEERGYDLELLTDPLLREALGREAIVWRVR